MTLKNLQSKYTDHREGSREFTPVSHILQGLVSRAMPGKFSTHIAIIVVSCLPEKEMHKKGGVRRAGSASETYIQVFMTRVRNEF